MKKSFIYFLICFLIVPQFLYAQEGYVSDMLLLTFREGPGTSYTVLKTLKSNTQVKVLREQNGFYQVTLENGETGWVDKKFINFDKPKAIIIKDLEKQLADLLKKNEALSSRRNEMNNRLNASKNENVQEIQSLEVKLEAILKENETLKKALNESKKKFNTLIEQSKDIQNIIQENNKLKSEKQSLSTELTTTKKANKNLLKSGMIKWVLAGVATLMLGWVLGRSISTRRRRAGSSLLD